MRNELDWELVDVLRRIDSGETHFEPADSSRQAMKDFQPLACTIVEAKRLGYIENVFPNQESNGGSLEYNWVLTAGGLTHRGRQLLKEALGHATPTDLSLDDIFTRLPDQHLRSQWEKTLSRRHTDPSGAVTAARSFLESTQKWILAQGGKPEPKPNQLFSATIQELGLTDQAKAMPELLQNIDNLLLSIKNVRHKHGDAHGPGDGSLNLSNADAALCVNLAGALGLFLLECHESQSR
ncbi:MAG: abortive infection family protein [Pseudomonas sp.]|uniref:abortive infection family protein n=1 Tax=Pseudomonas sp. TaxID=306 RepID=UPI003D6E37FE